jgi:hypothetical protein
MALVACLECNNSVSDKAEACPQCGAPVTFPMGAEDGIKATPNRNAAIDATLKYRITRRIRTDVKDCELRGELGAQLKRALPSFDIASMSMKRGLGSGQTWILLPSFTRIGEGWLVTIDHNVEKGPHPAVPLITDAIGVAAAWLFISGWLALAIAGGMFYFHFRPTLSRDIIDNCLMNVENQFAGKPISVSALLPLG